jgi:hypothetical protein
VFAFKRKPKKKQRLEDGTAVPAPADTLIQPPKKREPAPAIPTVRENYLLAEIERLKLLILSKTPERLVVVNQHGAAITIDMTADAEEPAPEPATVDPEKAEAAADTPEQAAADTPEPAADAEQAAGAPKPAAADEEPAADTPKDCTLLGDFCMMHI